MNYQWARILLARGTCTCTTIFGRYGKTYKKSDVKLSYEAHNIQEKTDIRTGNTQGSLEWDLVLGVSLDLSSMMESDVGDTDRLPGEEEGKIR